MEDFWGIWSDLKAEKRFISSGSAGLRCPASEVNKSSNRNDWQFIEAGKGWDRLLEGGVVVSCTVHDDQAKSNN